MYKAKLKNEQKYLLLELLKLLSEADGNVSYEEMTMIHNVMKMYKVKEYDYKNYTQDEIKTQLMDLKEDDRRNIITHAILLALSDGEFSETEQDMFKAYFDILDLDSVSYIQKMIEKYGKLEYDIRNMFYEGSNIEVIEDESVKMMNDFSDDSDEDLTDENIYKMNKGPVKKVWDQVLNLYKVFKDPKSDNVTKAIAIGALIYLITPIDAIPDFIPFAGLTDDVGIITYAVAQVTNMMKNKNVIK